MGNKKRLPMPPVTSSSSFGLVCSAESAVLERSDMSATSGISIHPDLQKEIASVKENIRFRKLVIRNETIVQEQSINLNSDLADDLNLLQEILQDNEPAYILAKQDHVSQWLLITYVPETAKIKDKMLYASSRSSLVKTLAAPDTLSVTLKSELTPSAYRAHLSQQAAPPPISERERQMEGIHAAELADAATGRPSAQSRTSHLGGARIDLEWAEDAVEAVKTFQTSENLLIFKIDASSEILSLTYSGVADPDDVSSKLPAEAPAFALYAFKTSTDSKPYTLFIYSCPNASPIKLKMIHSTASRIVQEKLKQLGVQVSRKLETSEPQEVRENWMKAEIAASEGNLDTSADNGKHKVSIGDTGRSFAKPKGPPRKQR